MEAYSSSRTTPPEEDELQDLFNLVWRDYTPAPVPPPSSPSTSNGVEFGTYPPSTRVVSSGPATPATAYPTSPDTPRANGSQSSRSGRPLPPVPGRAVGSSSKPALSVLPADGQGLPRAPSPFASRQPGLPSDPRHPLSSQLPHAARPSPTNSNSSSSLGGSSSRYPTNSAGMADSAPYSSTTSFESAPTSSRNPHTPDSLFRPPGASAPKTPEYDGGVRVSNGSDSSNEFYSQQQNKSLQRNPPAALANDFEGPEATYEVASKSLDRSFSVGSSIASNSLDRNDSFSNLYSTYASIPEHSRTASTSRPTHTPAQASGSWTPNTGYVASSASGRTTTQRAMDEAAANEAKLPHKGPLELHDDDDDDDFEDDDVDRFFNCSLLSHIAVRLRDKVPRDTQVKSSIPYPRAFTGKDIVSVIQAQIQRELYYNRSIPPSDRRLALQLARSLQSQLFFYEVEWGGRILSDGVEDVFMFLDDQEGASDSRLEQDELPNGVFTPLTKCYSPSCGDGNPCYAYACPTRRDTTLGREPSAAPSVEPTREMGEWSTTVDPDILNTLPESEISRQTIIHKIISKEEQYVQDLELVDSLFIRPLREANPPIIRPDDLDEFMEEVFGNILEIRSCNRRLLEEMYIRQREQAPIIKSIGDIFLEAATRFRDAYPKYVGCLPLAEKRVKDEMEENPDFRLFLEQRARVPEARRMDLKHFLSRPSEHLQRYPVLLDAIHGETASENPDGDYLLEAIQAIKNLQTVAQLRTFQSAMGKGPTGKLEWHDLVSKEFMESLPKNERKRQSIIFELIKGEMAYVKDLENIDVMYIRPLRAANPSIIPRDRIQAFISDVFHNFHQLFMHHSQMLEKLHQIQREEHPVIQSITAPVFDAALNWREAYLEYVPNYPIAAYRIDDEMANNAAFKTFVDQCVRHADAHRLDMKNFINRPIPRLLRYELLLKNIMEESPADHDDQQAIPHVIEVIKALGKETEPGVQTAKQKVELWRYNSNLVFRSGETIDLDLLDETRTLIHTGKLLRQPETSLEWSGWSELFVLVFNNYMVMTKPKEKDGVMKYQVNRRPIPLDLLTLTNFTDPPQTRGGTGLIPRALNRGNRGGGGGAGHLESNPSISGMNGVDGVGDARGDARTVYPFTIHHNGRMGGLLTLFAESATAREEWKKKLEEAIVLRKVVQESNKVFELETLSADTFLVPAIHANAVNQSWNDEHMFTGKVTCSVPFSTADGRGLVAIGCAEGVWIGLRHDSRSMRRVLHLKQVTQCAMLEDFGIFLVLADKSLFAYHIEALVPSSPPSANATRTPQKLNGNKDVQFFSVGNLHGRTLIIYMKKKGLDSVFRVLEPVVGKIAEKTKAPAGLGRFLGNTRSEWFRVYRDFFLPSESFDLFFLKAKIAILCTRGFEIMDLTDFKSVTIPQREDPRLQQLARRCESCKPIGMFRSNENEFLLVYDEFGLYVDRHGDPSRSIGTIEWEGTAEKAAWHPPYVLLFDSRFIEVRHVETGRLAQIIPGNDVRCIWDGRNASLPPIQTPGPEGWQETISQEARVHAVMRAPETTTNQHGPQRAAKAVPQLVCELVPTIPLYLPGALSSPNTSTYFPPSSSPPHSPQLSHNSSWN